MCLHKGGGKSAVNSICTPATHDMGESRDVQAFEAKKLTGMASTIYVGNGFADCGPTPV